MPERSALANKVREFRKQHNESQQMFAEHADISEDSVGLIERCKANPRLNTIQNIAAYMDKTVAELLSVEYEIPPYG